MLRGPFPPRLALPTLGDPWIARLRPLAQGQPGDLVAHGLFPGRLTKLARLVLACAIVDLRIDAGPLLRAYLGDTARQRGWRSRRKTWALPRWAQQYGYLRNDCACIKAPAD